MKSFFGRTIMGSVMLAGLSASTTAFGANIVLDNYLVNSNFVGTVAGNCPTSWTCSGSPSPGFTAYTVTGNQYANIYAGGFSPLGGLAATSPTLVEGHGDLSQTGLGGLTYLAGNTYTISVWVGTPNNVPLVSPLTPAGKVGVITVYFTGAGGAALSDGAFNATIPSPGTWTLETFTLTPGAGDFGQSLGLDIHVDSTQPSGGSGNNDIANFQFVPEPASLLLSGLGIAGLGLLRFRRRAA